MAHAAAAAAAAYAAVICWLRFSAAFKPCHVATSHAMPAEAARCRQRWADAAAMLLLPCQLEWFTLLRHGHATHYWLRHAMPLLLMPCRAKDIMLLLMLLLLLLFMLLIIAYSFANMLLLRILLIMPLILPLFNYINNIIFSLLPHTLLINNNNTVSIGYIRPINNNNNNNYFSLSFS